MNLFKKNNSLYFEFNELLVVNNYGSLEGLDSDLVETSKIKITGKNFYILYLDEFQIKIQGEIKNICIK